MKMTKKTPFLAACALATGLAAASATFVLAQPLGGAPPVRPPLGRPQQDDQRAMYREERFVRHLYEGFLDRRPSPEEMRTWTRKLGGGERPIDLVRAFMDSDEYFVRQTYRALLGRDPDPSGLDTYLRSLRRGESREEVVESILRSPEFRRRLK